MIARAILALSMALAPNAWGQESHGVTFYGDFSGGLNTFVSPVLIKDNESPALQNVLVDKNGAVSRREGFLQTNAAAIGGGLQDVNSAYELEQLDGDKFCVAFSSTSGFFSLDGCATFTVFVDSITLGNDVNCDALNDKLYCTSNGYNFAFDGTDDFDFNAPANLDYIRVHRNRCLAAGQDSNPDRLYWSSLGDCETWSELLDFIDVSPQDGDTITGIGEPIFDMLPIYKKFSTWALQGTGPLDWKLINISKDTGALNHRSSRNFNNLQLFDSVGSNGGQPVTYAFNALYAREVSRKVRDSLDQLDTFKVAFGRKVQDTAADFLAANLEVEPGMVFSATISPGSVHSSTFSRLDIEDADWEEGTIPSTLQVTSDTLRARFPTVVEDDSQADFQASVESSTVSFTAIAGSVVLESSETTTNPGFETGNLNGWTNTGSHFIAFNLCNSGGFCDSRARTGNDQMEVQTTGGTTICSFAIGSQGFYVTFTCPAATIAGFVSVGTDIRWAVRNAGVIEFVQNFRWLGGTCTSRVGEFSGLLRFDDFACPGFEEQGFWTSQTFDSGIDTPVFGNLNVVETVPSGSTTTYGIQVSDDGINWDAEVVTVPGQPVLAAEKRFVRYSTTFTHTANDVTPQVDSVMIPIISTGIYLSPVFDSGFTTPTWSELILDATEDQPDDLIIETAVSTDSVCCFDPFLIATESVKIPSDPKRFIKYRATFGISFSTNPPVLDSIELAAATTGFFIHDCFFVGNKINEWGLLQGESSDGDGATSFEVVPGGSCNEVTRTTATFVSQSNNSTILVATAPYLGVRTTLDGFSIYFATALPTLESLTINWSEGSTSKSASAVVFKDRYHYGGQSAGGSINDTMFVLDANGAWTRWVGVRPRHLNIISQRFIVSDSSETGGGFLHELYQTDSDNGVAINAFFETKDFALGGIWRNKAMDRWYLVHKADNTDLTVTIKSDTGTDSETFSVLLATGATFGVIKEVVEPTIEGYTFRMRVENNAVTAPWEILGIGFEPRDIGGFSND